MDSMQYKIAGRRKELNLTQNELAEKIGVSAKVISKWETGRSIPDTIFWSRSATRCKCVWSFC